MNVIEILKKLGIEIPKDKIKEIEEETKGLQNQDAINAIVGKAKSKASEKAQLKLVQDLGFDTMEELKSKISTNSEEVKPNAKKDDEGQKDTENKSEILATVKKEIEDFKKSIKEDYSKKETEINQIKTLEKMGFNSEQSKAMRNLVISNTDDETDFNAAIDKMKEKPLYKSQFQLAEEQLKVGTIKTESIPGKDLPDEIADEVANIFGNKKD